MARFFLLLLFFSINVSALTDGRYVVDGRPGSVSARPFTSLFGDRICVNRHGVISMHFNYGIPNYLVSTSSNGSGSVEYDSDNSMAIIKTGSGLSSANASIVSRRRLVPKPFYESYLYTVVGFDVSSVVGTRQWIGLFDDDNGFAVGMKDGQFGIMYRRQGGPDVFINKIDFNIDRLDGYGPSRTTINPGNINIFRMCNGWMGSAPIIFELLTPEGAWYPFHVLTQTNNLSVPGFKSPVLPICAQVKRVSGSSSASMKVVAFEAGIVGDKEDGSGRVFALARSNIKVKNNKTKPILTIRNKSTYKSKLNQIEMRLLFMELAAESGDARFSVVLNGNLRGARFGDVDSESIMEKDVAATSVSGGKKLWYSYVTRNHGSKEYYLKQNGIDIVLMPGDTLTFLAHGVLSDPDCDVSILWEEVI